jgi:hypothetical protein
MVVLVYETYVVIVWYDGLHCFKTLGNAKFNVISVFPIDVIVYSIELFVVSQW